jgi:hypothetical protein
VSSSLLDDGGGEKGYGERRSTQQVSRVLNFTGLFFIFCERTLLFVIGSKTELLPLLLRRTD